MPKLLVFVGHKGSGKDAAANFLRMIQQQSGHSWSNVKMAGGLKAMLRGAYHKIGFPSHTIQRMLEGDLKEDGNYGCEPAVFESTAIRHRMVVELLNYQGKSSIRLQDDPDKETDLLFGMSFNQMRSSLRHAWVETHFKVFAEENTPRHLMQTLGTEWGRQSVDPEIWVKLTKANILAQQAEGFDVVVTDARFENEIAMLQELGARIVHIDRPGLTVDLSHPSEQQISTLPYDHKIINDGTLLDLGENIIPLVRPA